MARVKMAVLLSGVATLALSAGGAQAQSWLGGQPRWVAGDIHNHTTCIDGSVSLQWLLDKSLDTWGLDWFVHANHGGAGTRDCRFMDPEYDGSATGEGHYWVETLGQKIQNVTIDKIKGDFAESNEYSPSGANHQLMWRWQSVQEVDYPIISERGRFYKKPAIEGVEQNVPGHEHADTAIIAGQSPKNGTGDANAMAQYEYLFDRNDQDTSGGGGQGWTGKITGPEANTGLAGDSKTLKGVAWQQANYPLSGYFVPTHVERQGPFNPAANKGYNIENFRDENNAGPTVAFGFEGPGHAAEHERGSYLPKAVGGGTYGGRGYYVAAVGGVWDALLHEGRNWFYFGSSDFHQRGIFGPSDKYTTADFYPGEFERNYVRTNAQNLRPQNIVDGLRSGNSYNVMGDLIGNDMVYRACSEDTGACAEMGQTLVIPPGGAVRVDMTVSTPRDNNSPYTFANPLLAQIGVSQPLNAPVLDHIDFIKGYVDKKVSPTSPFYKVPTYTPTGTPALFRTFNKKNWSANGVLRTVSFRITNNQEAFYIRARGTNLPPGVPNVTDSQGNPLVDTNIDNVPCLDAACPAHLPIAPAGSPIAGKKFVDFDVEAWSSLWFYSNPIFVRPSNKPMLAVEQAAILASRTALQASK